jgi:hypothetical protein
LFVGISDGTSSVGENVGINRVVFAEEIVVLYSFVRTEVEHSQEAKKLGSCNESHVEGGICPIKPAASSSPHDVNCPESSNTALSWFEILPTPQMLQTGLGNFDSDIVEFLAVGLVDGVFDDTSAVGCDVSL